MSESPTPSIPGPPRRRGQTMPVPVNVTARFADLAPEDTVYETTEGFLVKVKVLWDHGESGHGLEKFHVTGSIVGENGKAMLREDGSPAVHMLGRTHQHMSDALQDPIIGIEWARIECVWETVRSELSYQMVRGYTQGMVSRTQFNDRKAAEAAQETPDAVP